MPDGSSVPHQNLSSTRSEDGFLAGGGEMGARIRAFDWSKTAIGPVAAWPQSLRTSVSTCLNCAFPIILWWGRELAVLYNDEYGTILGPKHPAVLGKPGADVWPEIWDVIGPMLSQVIERGEATRSRDLLLHVNRGYLEEAYFSFSYSPIHKEDGGVGGVFCPVIETTEKVIGERRLRTLRDLAARCKGAESEQAAYTAAAHVLAANPHDVPFALVYRIDDEQPAALLAATAGIQPGAGASPPRIDLLADTSSGWPLGAVSASGTTAVVTDLTTRFDALPSGAWRIQPHTAVMLPVLPPGGDRPRAIIVAAVSPMRAMDDDHRTFFELLATQVASAVADAQALEQERTRAEALAEIDRAKTAFFSNVSHEFRTPLTLMLGPLEDILGQPADQMVANEWEMLKVVHRNGLRLQKLVNTLLDFSRIEAGRLQASFEPTDIAALTADLASNFQSACDRAGIRLVIDCPSVGEPVYVDRDMWEKVVLNLLSNAFKFTLEGEIVVALQATRDAVELVVHDTGTGIPSEELPHIFERFHRVKNTLGRTHEGTGIGLALVQELVRLHGGTVEAHSVLRRGSIFRVAIPKGKGHLPSDRIGATRALASTALGSSPFVEEALRWIPDSDASGHGSPLDDTAVASNVPAAIVPSGVARTGSERPRARILWADDNADMRSYVGRLLSADYDVASVSDGREALAAARAQPPDLVVTDVMMPQLDGFELLRELRADPATRSIPVILLSARAGEEARIEGLHAGADDYIVKPFSARELVTRIAARLELRALSRRFEDERMALLTDAVHAREEFLAIASHELRNPVNALQLQLTALLYAIRDHNRTVTSEWAAERVGHAVTAVQRLVQLIETFLDVSRITAGRLDLLPEEMDLADAVRAAIDRFQEQLAAVEVVTRIDPVVGQWDRMRVEQIVGNLVSNAVKYGNGRPIEISLHADDGMAHLSVADHGIGMDEEIQARVFGKFERAVSRQHYGGFGLELWITRQVIDAMGGRISVESRMGEGSTFRVALPCTPAESVSSASVVP